MRRHCLEILLLCMVAGGWGQSLPREGPRRCTATGNLEIREFESLIFNNSRKLRILLPAGYRDKQNAKRLYPVLYLNDGQNLFDVCTAIFNPLEWRVDETANRLVAEKQIEPLIIVGIDNAGKRDRPREYLPFPDDTLNPYIADVHGTEYPAFLTREVMPFIARNYRVKKGAQNTGLGGSSYGALITLYTALHTNNVFGRILIESPSVYVKDFEILKQAAHHEQWPSLIYLGGGTEEGPSSDVDSIPNSLQRIAGILKVNNVAPERILVNVTAGKHDEQAWAMRFPSALKFLFPRKPSEEH